MAKDITTPLMVVTVIAATFLIGVWISLILWTGRDIRRRSQDKLVIILSITSVVLLNFIGFVIYLILRPLSTISQEYQQALEEEALLQSLEPQFRCSACGSPVMDNWQFCPFCQAKLVSSCPNCQTLLQTNWSFCPNCGQKRDVNEMNTDEVSIEQSDDLNFPLNVNANEDLLIEETDIESL